MKFVTPMAAAWLRTPFLILLSLSVCFASDVITLKNGDRLTGTIIERTADSVTLETPYAGVITVKADQIEKVVADPASVPAAPPQPPPPPSLLGDLTEGWDGALDAGFSYTSGNSKTTTLVTAVTAEKTGDGDKLAVYGRTQFNSNRNSGIGVTTQNAVLAGLRYSRDINRKMFAFVSYDIERDLPKQLNFRSVLGGGLGYHLIKNDRTEADLLFGAAWNRAWRVGPDSSTAEALAGVALKHKITDRLKLQNSYTYFQSIQTARKYRFVYDATLTADITKRFGLFVSVGDRFDNDPGGTSEKNDFLLTTGVRWSFGEKSKK